MDRLGCVPGASWRALGASWMLKHVQEKQASLGASWSVLDSSRSILGQGGRVHSLQERLGRAFFTPWRLLGTVLAHLGRVLSASWRVLGASCSAQKSILTRLVAILGDLDSILIRPRRISKNIEKPKAIQCFFRVAGPILAAS